MALASQKGVNQNGKSGTSTSGPSRNAIQTPAVAWYHQLPHVSPPIIRPSTGQYYTDSFKIQDLIGAIQHGYPVTEIDKLLAYYQQNDEKLLKTKLNEKVNGFPAMFYVVETNNIELIRCWVKYGGDLKATHGKDQFPLLAFAALRDADTQMKAAKTLQTLLCLGASPQVIPRAYYTPYDRDLPSSGPPDNELYDIRDNNKLWCSPQIRPLLATALNLTQRYRLWQASSVDPNSGREQELVSRKGAHGVLRLHLTVIGQKIAARSITQELLVHLARPTRAPLVLLFAGPSGHGKTEIARRLGEIMSLELETVDCTNFQREDELFGPKPPYHGHQLGSPLNNFLSRNTGKRCIVFMDEFDRTDVVIHNALLIPFDQGEYADRRNATKINCRNTIWVLATNKFDNTIHEFCKAHKEILTNSDREREQSMLMERLSKTLLKESTGHFGAPLTGRISRIIPFLTFNSGEQAIVAHRGIMELEEEVAGPVVLSANPEEDKLVGNVWNKMSSQFTVCSKIAQRYYEPQLGARCIFRGVQETIIKSLVGQYLKDGEYFSETQPDTWFKVGVNHHEDDVRVWITPKDDRGATALGKRRRIE
ncbi:P-loop containing nucleoside triphosphate hydrolase protein [Whalleya microplaca]|nr:P-loop containing nucleoside triphosphate hydrolase protein [Whalleya microplaca]